MVYMGVSKNRGKTPKMDGENNGNHYFLMDDLEGKTQHFRKHPYVGYLRYSPKGCPTFPCSSGMVLGKIVQITYGQARLESLPQAVWLLERLEVGDGCCETPFKSKKTTGGNCLVIVEWTPTVLVDSCKQLHLSDYNGKTPGTQIQKVVLDRNPPKDDLKPHEVLWFI